MPLIRKLNPGWKPAEKPDLQVGETIDITDPTILLKNRSVILVDEVTGKDIPFTNSLECQFCDFTTIDLEEYTKHLTTHVEKPKASPIPKSATTSEVTSKVYKCKQCDFTTTKVIELAQHARLNHPSDKYRSGKSAK